MKIAIVFTGVPRMLIPSSSVIRQRLIGDYDVDVYSYTWRLAEWERLGDLYDYTEMEIWDPQEYERFPPNSHNIFPHWYGVQRACRAFGSHVNQHDLHYHLVVRTRHDIYPHWGIRYEQLDPNLFNVSARHWPNHPSFIYDDNLTVTSQENYLDFYDGFFDWYLKRPMHHYSDISEDMLAEYTVTRGFHHRVNPVQMLDFELTRGVLGGEWAAQEVKSRIP